MNKRMQDEPNCTDLATMPRCPGEPDLRDADADADADADNAPYDKKTPPPLRRA